MGDQDKSKEKTEIFTIQERTQTGANVPSVTKLLNRKSLALKKDPPQSPAASPSLSIPSSPPSITLEEPPVTASSPSEISIHFETSEPEHFKPEHLEIESRDKTSSSSLPKIQPASPNRRNSHPNSPILIWDAQILKSGSDPLGKGIVEMLRKGASSALFLAITPPPAGSPTPHFVSTAAVLPQDKLTLWTGLKWDPTVVPELWNYFVKAGTAELSPPGTLTNQASTRNVVRTAFGVRRTEWLLLVRVGSPQACRGVIALISTQSLMSEVSSVLPLLTADLPKKVA
jgi:hypothetical protein